MSRQKPGKSKSTPTSTDDAGQRTSDLSEWTDEPAKARSLDDPREPPRDSVGLPSSGERYSQNPRNR
jgi:hypothetical protein